MAPRSGSTVHFSHHRVDAADDRRDAGQETILADVMHDGQVAETRPARLDPRRDGRPIAGDQEAQLPARVLTLEIHFTLRQLEVFWHFTDVLTRGQLLQGLANDVRRPVH